MNDEEELKYPDYLFTHMQDILAENKLLKSRLTAMERAFYGDCNYCVHRIPDIDRKCGKGFCVGSFDCPFQFDEARFAGNKTQNLTHNSDSTGNKMIPVEGECDEIEVSSTAKPAPSIERQLEIKDAEIARLKAQIDWLCNRIGRWSMLPPDGILRRDPVDSTKAWKAATERAVEAEAARSRQQVRAIEVNNG